MTYLGPYIKLGESPIKFSRRAPLIGEHNDEILGGLDLGDKQAPKASQGTVNDASRSKSMPFEGVKVLDFTWIGVGPVTIKYLGDHGADVIHVESVSRPDGLRSAPPFKDGQSGINRSQFPANFNTSKYGLGLNMAKPEAVELIKRVIAEWQPDIISESFTPKAMRNWGLDYESVKKIKPDIIYFSTCQQGQTGPRAMYPGYGQLASSLAGYYQITGWPEREPVTPYGAYSDFVNPPNGFAAIVAALEYRRRTGKGQHLDLSQYEGAMHYKAPVIMDYLVNGRITIRNGNRDEVYVPHGVYPCKDEVRALTGPGESWCAIAVTTDEEWEALCDAMGSPAWTQEARFATFANRKENEDELDSLLGEWTAQYQGPRGHAPTSEGWRSRRGGAESGRFVGRPSAKAPKAFPVAQPYRVRPDALRRPSVLAIEDTRKAAPPGPHRRAQRANPQGVHKPHRRRNRQPGGFRSSGDFFLRETLNRVCNLYIVAFSD